MAKLTQAAARAEAAAAVIDSGSKAKGDATEVDPPRRSSNGLQRPTPRPQPVGRPILDPIAAMDAPAPKLRGPGGKIVGALLLLAIAGGGYGIYWKIQSDRAESEKNKKERDELQKKLDDDAAARQKDLENQLVDPGTIKITSNPGNAGVWLKIGTTPLTSMELTNQYSHELALTHDGYDAAEVQIVPDGKPESLAASVTLTAHVDKANQKAPGHDAMLPPLQSTGLRKTTSLNNKGRMVIKSTPDGADVWLFLGATNPTAQIDQVPAGRPYEVLVQKPKFKPKRVPISADDWRMPGASDAGNPNIDAAKKKDVFEVNADLEAVDAKAAH